MSWLLYLVVLAIGGFGGYMLAKTRNPDTRVRELEDHLQSLQQKYDQYQDSVTQHFISSAQMINELSSHYREVHEHLRKGAETLCADSRRHGTSNPALAFEPLSSAHSKDSAFSHHSSPHAMEPPRDYATKSPDDKGTLDEEYGFRN